jgi:glutathione peroxidase
MLIPLLCTMMVSPPGFHDFVLDSIEGKPMELSKFKGKAALVVNVASACGLTPQYAGLQALYEKHRNQGFVVLGVPCNQFGNQEPGDEAQIKEFCSAKYSVTFPMSSKVEVNGEGRHPLYRWLIENSDRKDDIQWNFAKFLVSRSGQVLARFAPRTSPDDPALVEAVQKALAD